MTTATDNTVIADADGLTSVCAEETSPAKSAAVGEPEQALRRRCAWCAEVQDGLGPIPPGARVSHGMCAACAVRFEQGAADPP